MPIIGESGPLTFGGDQEVTKVPPPTQAEQPYTQVTQPTYTPPPATATEFTIRHIEFINSVNSVGSCFSKDQIKGFSNEDFDQHAQVAEVDKYITQLKNHPGIYCTEQYTQNIIKTLKRYTD